MSERRIIQLLAHLPSKIQVAELGPILDYVLEKLNPTESPVQVYEPTLAPDPFQGVQFISEPLQGKVSLTTYSPWLDHGEKKIVPPDDLLTKNLRLLWEREFGEREEDHENKGHFLYSRDGERILQEALDFVKLARRWSYLPRCAGLENRQFGVLVGIETVIVPYQPTEKVKGIPTVEVDTFLELQRIFSNRPRESKKMSH